jgi:hypothetical protein
MSLFNFNDPLTKKLSTLAEEILTEKVVAEDEVTDEDAGDFTIAAAAAKKAGKKKFKFGGKEYPVTIKSDIKTEEVDEDDEEEEVDEAKRKGAPKIKGDSIKIQRAKDKEHADAMGRHVKSGRKKSVKEEAEALEELTAAEKKLIDQMYDKKGNLTPLGKKVMAAGSNASKLSPKDKDADNARRKDYKAYQKANRNEEVELDEDLSEKVVIDYDSGLDTDDKDLQKLAKKMKIKIKVTGTDPNGFDEVRFTFPDQKAVDKFQKITGIDLDEEVELDEAMKITHVVIDTADDDKVVSMASDEKGAKSSIVSAERPPMSIKDKKTLKVVKLKKPAGQKAADRLIGYPLKEEDLQEYGYIKSNYTVKHKTFSSAIQHAVEVAAKKGYEVDPDDYDRKVAMGPKKPSSGKTNSYSIKLSKNGKEQKKALQVQIANLDNKSYELNMYIQ